MNTIKECFDTILNGGEEKSRQAARRVRKLVYSSPAEGREEHAEIVALVYMAPESYARISEDWRQENFVMAISVIYFLHDRENQPDFLFPWFFRLLQHKNGNVRQAAVRMTNHELGSLTYHIRFPGRSSGFKKLSPEQADRILAGLETNLSNLEKGSWRESYKKYTYITDLPSGTYKSVQLIVSYLEDLCSEIGQSQKIESFVNANSIEQILERRKEIEQELVDILKETKSDFTLQDVQDVIFHEEGTDDMMKVVAMFDRGAYASELSNVLELVTDAWNYFPHKILGGISPAEKLSQYQ